jgi:hypothetical protein
MAEERRADWMTHSDCDKAFDQFDARVKGFENKIYAIADESKERHAELRELLINQAALLGTVVDLSKKHDVMLIGDGRGGLVADTNEMKTGLTIIKWVTGIMGGGVASGIAHLYSKITGGH